MPIKIARVTAVETSPLRQAVLRPHETVDDLVGADGGDSRAAYFAAVDDNEVIGTGWVQPEEPPWRGAQGLSAGDPSDLATSWRLRGMATAEGRRGQGVGGSILRAAIDHVRRQGGRLVWCNARIPAMAFYERGGFATRGEPWVDPLIGPHVAMELRLDDPRQIAAL